MAEGSVTGLRPAQVPAMPLGLSTSLTEEEKRQVEECEKILRFQDRVLSGAHPSIKVSSHLFASKQSSEPQSTASVSASAQASSPGRSGQGQGRTVSSFGKPPPKGPKLSRANATKKPTNSTAAQVANLRSFGANAARSVPAAHPVAVLLPGLDRLSLFSSTMDGVPTGPRADAGKRASDSSANAQFDPVLLTKSEDLIKAEFHLQRQRLERTLAEQLQQHRISTKVANTLEAPVDFDLASVLMQALLRAQSSAPPQTDANLAANQSGPGSDSNSTFYSSKHDTPESHLEQRIPESDEAEAVQGGEDSPYEPPMVMDASSIPGQAPMLAIPPAIASNPRVTTRHATDYQHPSSNPVAQPPPSIANIPVHDVRTAQSSLQHGNHGFGGKNTAQEANGAPIEISSSQESGEGSSSRNSGAAAVAQPSTQNFLGSSSRHMIEQAFGPHQAPILRAHNLSPIAPQPAHVSPLATSRQPPMPQQDAPQPQATSAHIAALRADHSNGSSPDSSPQGKAGKKKKKNDKKRKADRMAANNASAPYIKPEPRSLSPLTAPQFPRQANKRMRSAQHQRQEQSTNEPRYEENEEIAESAHPSSYPPRFYREDRGPAYGSPSIPPTQQDTRVVMIPESSRYEHQYHDEPRPVRYIRRGSLGAQPYPYPPAEVRTYRSVSRAAIDPPYPYHDLRDQPRTVMRPAADRDRSRSPMLIEDRTPSAMGPPAQPAARVFLDEFGREYIEPPTRQEPVVIRRSVASRPVYSDREAIYDAPRATSRIVRRSVAPSSMHGEPEFSHERAPPARAASVMPGSGRYEEEVVYRTPISQAGYSPAGYSAAGYSPAGHTTTRRVVTRHELPTEYRYYRERDYPSQPPIQPGGGDYVAVWDSRPPMSEQQYVVRYTTARPESPGRSEAVRMSSVRPELVPGDYGAPIQLDTQAMPPPRSYSVRPMAPPPPPQQGQYVRQWPE